MSRKTRKKDPFFFIRIKYPSRVQLARIFIRERNGFEKEALESKRLTTKRWLQGASHGFQLALNYLHDVDGWPEATKMALNKTHIYCKPKYKSLSLNQLVGKKIANERI